MSEIARRAGVVRATIYAHFPTRDALLDAVMDHAIAEVVEAIRATEPERGEPLEALARLLRATWQELDRFHALVSINIGRLPQEEFHRRHLPFVEQIAPLIERGQRDGVFRSDLPVAWHLSVALAIVHAASGELRSGRIAHGEAEAAMISTTLAAVSERREV
jgi:AcrR family transcriptional regulator